MRATRPTGRTLALVVIGLAWLSRPVASQEVNPEDLLQENHPPRPVTLIECLEIALANQPRIHGELSSQASSEVQARYIDRLRPLARLSQPLAARVHQSDIGRERAQVALDQQVEDTFYMVRRAFFTYVYAKRLQALVEPVEQLVGRTEKALATKKLVEKATGKWNSEKENQLMRLRIEQAMVQEKVNDAKAGIRESIALLLEEMGGSTRLGFQPVPIATDLPGPSPRLSLPDLLALVEDHSGELRQAMAGRQAMQWEVRAQDQFAFFRKAVPTFAAFSDTKTIPIPPAERGELIVRPTVPGLETPHNLAGPRRVRLERAALLADRACSVEESVRSLVRLQMRRTYEEYVDVQANITIIGDRARNAREYLDGLSGKIFTESESQLVVASTQLIREWERIRFLRCILLADMVRQTGGAMQVDWDQDSSRQSPPLQTEPQSEPKPTN